MDGRDERRVRTFGPAHSRKTLEIKSSRKNPGKPEIVQAKRTPNAQNWLKNK